MFHGIKFKKKKNYKMDKVITIDGLASSGKSTLSRLLAKKLGWNWLSTGIFYRGMAYIGLKEKFNKSENNFLFDEKNYLQLINSKDWFIKTTEAKSLFFYKEENISSQLYKEEIDIQSSLFSENSLFRKALILTQRNFCTSYLKTGLILEGRDCGTVLFPSAPLKIFLEANEFARAERRAKDRNQAKKTVFDAQKERDQRDKNRNFAPLVKPDNSICLDSSDKSAEELADFVYKKAQFFFCR